MIKRLILFSAIFALSLTSTSQASNPENLVGDDSTNSNDNSAPLRGNTPPFMEPENPEEECSLGSSHASSKLSQEAIKLKGSMYPKDLDEMIEIIRNHKNLFESSTYSLFCKFYEQSKVEVPETIKTDLEEVEAEIQIINKNLEIYKEEMEELNNVITYTRAETEDRDTKLWSLEFKERTEKERLEESEEKKKYLIGELNLPSSYSFQLELIAFKMFDKIWTAWSIGHPKGFTASILTSPALDDNFSKIFALHEAINTKYFLKPEGQKLFFKRLARLQNAEEKFELFKKTSVLMYSAATKIPPASIKKQTLGTLAAKMLFLDSLKMRIGFFAYVLGYEKLLEVAKKLGMKKAETN